MATTGAQPGAGPQADRVEWDEESYAATQPAFQPNSGDVSQSWHWLGTFLGSTHSRNVWLLVLTRLWWRDWLCQHSVDARGAGLRARVAGRRGTRGILQPG